MKKSGPRIAAVALSALFAAYGFNASSKAQDNTDGVWQLDSIESVSIIMTVKRPTQTWPVTKREWTAIWTQTVEGRGERKATINLVFTNLQETFKPKDSLHIGPIKVTVEITGASADATWTKEPMPDTGLWKPTGEVRTSSGYLLQLGPDPAGMSDRFPAGQKKEYLEGLTAWQDFTPPFPKEDFTATYSALIDDNGPAYSRRGGDFEGKYIGGMSILLHYKWLPNSSGNANNGAFSRTTTPTAALPSSAMTSPQITNPPQTMTGGGGNAGAAAAGRQVITPVPVPRVMKQCETGQQQICGTWTLEGNQFHAVWVNGARAIITVQRFDNGGVLIIRQDTGATSGFTARYTGQISGNRIINGIVTWSANGQTWSGTWTANW